MGDVGEHDVPHEAHAVDVDHLEVLGDDGEVAVLRGHPEAPVALGGGPPLVAQRVAHLAAAFALERAHAHDERAVERDAEQQLVRRHLPHRAVPEQSVQRAVPVVQRRAHEAEPERPHRKPPPHVQLKRAPRLCRRDSLRTVIP